MHGEATWQSCCHVPIYEHLILQLRVFNAATVLLYPEWPHRQCLGLVFRRSHVRRSLSAVSLVICSPARIAVCKRGAQGVLPCVGWGCNQSIGSTVSDAIVGSWLWSTATRSSQLGYFSKLLQVVDN